MTSSHSGMKLEPWVAQIETKFRALAARSRSSHGGAYAGTDLEYLGVRTADWRALVRRLDAELPVSWEECVRALWKSPVFEARATAIGLATRHQREFTKSDWSLFFGWLKESVGWAMIDGLCDAVIAPMLVRYPELAQKTHAWVRSRNVWLRRASLVAFCTTVRDRLYADEAFAHTAGLLADRDPMVTKAVSWILRALIKHYPKRVQSFLRQHQSKIAPTALREVRLKLTTGTKSGSARQRKGDK